MRQMIPVVFWCAWAACAAAAEIPTGFQPWSGAAVSDWGNHARPVVLTDMTRAEPPAFFSPKPRRGHWQVVPYEMRADKGGHKGKAVWCGYESDPPELKIKMGVKGWHAVFIGLLCNTGAWVKLEGDMAPLWRNNGVRDYYVNSIDTFFKAAELNEESILCINPRRHGMKLPAGVTHIVLIPLTPQEVDRLKKDRADTSHRTMAATCDGFSFLCGGSPRSAEDFLAELELYRHSDFGTLILHGGWGGDKTIYPSKVGHMPGQDLEDVCQSYHRDFIDSVKTMANKKINPLKVMIDGAHDAGMKVHVGVRPAGWSYYQPFNGLWDTPFYLNNPQWRCVDHASHGSVEVTRMSWAVAEVRKHIIDLLAEQVGFGADGAHIVFNRGYPVVLFEKPFCELFQKKHGVDPNQLKEDDPRIIEMWSDVVCTFFRELRAMLDKEEKRRSDGQRLAISVNVLGTNEDNIQYGVDIRRLVGEGLLNSVFIYQYNFGATKKGGYDVAFFRDACEAKGVPFAPSVDPPYDLEGQLKAAVALYEGGAKRLLFWDAGHSGLDKWAIQTRLGHVEESRWRRDNLDANKMPRSIHFFKWWGEQRMDGRFPPYWGG